MISALSRSVLSRDFHHSIKAIKGLNCSAHLDLLRGIDAVMVVLVHLSDMFFALSRDNPSFLGKAAMFLVVQGISSVITFFVLSGYLISMSIFDPLRAGRFDWRVYLVNRLSRLYVVLIPALILGAGWDWLGIKLFGLSSVYGGVTLGSICVPPSAVSHLTWQNFVGSLFFLQDIRCHTFGTNAVLWSLSCEFWYYMIFPALLLAFYKGTRPVWLRILLAAGGVAGLLFIGPLMCFRFLLWLMGTLLIFCPLLGWFKTGTGRVVALVLGAVCFIWRLTITPAFGSDQRILVEVLLGLSCMLTLYFVLHDKGRITPSREAQKLEDGAAEPSKALSGYVGLSGFFASFSYSLYLVHMPFLFFLRQLIIKEERWPLDPPHILCGLGVLALVLFYAWLVAYCTENQTAKVRAFFMRLTQRRTHGA